MLSGVPVGNATVSPATQAVTIGQTATVRVTGTGLTAGQRYLGSGGAYAISINRMVAPANQVVKACGL